MNMTSRPLIQDLVKDAIEKDASRAKIAAEGARQLAEESSKEASAPADPQSISTDYAMKLAAAIEYATPQIVKAAAVHLSGGGTHDPAAPPEGTSASNQKGHQPFVPSGQGKGHHQPPTHPGMQASNHGPANQMENTINHHVPGEQTTAMSGGKGKTAEAETPSLEQKNLAVIAKLAFSFSDAGHDFDASSYGAMADAIGKRREARDAYHKAAPELGMYHNVAPFAGLPTDNTVGLVPRLMDAIQERHMDYAAKKHEGGENAWNPFGGMLTPTAREEKHDAAMKAERAAKKEASALAENFLAATKVAEDAINPAHISAGAAVPPETSAAGEPGGQPVAGAPQGPSSLVGSNESAMHYKKNQAYAPRKGELRQYFNEPALTSQTDKTLQEAFAHTGEAGTKLSSAPSVKTAAAHALLMKLADKTAGKVG